MGWDMTTKVSNAQKKATLRWIDKNKEHRTYLSMRSSAKSFIKNKATIEDLEDMEKLIKEIKKIKNI